MTSNPNILTDADLCKIMQLKSPGAVEKRLLSQGIRPFPGGKGHFFITIQQLNHARGIAPGPAVNDDELID